MASLRSDGLGWIVWNGWSPAFGFRALSFAFWSNAIWLAWVVSSHALLVALLTAWVVSGTSGAGDRPDEEDDVGSSAESPWRRVFEDVRCYFASGTHAEALGLTAEEAADVAMVKKR